jgi:hypothetical protein
MGGTTSRWCLTVSCCFAALAGCGQSSDQPAARTPAPAPRVVLTADDEERWAPRPVNRSVVPVLVYDRVAPKDFARQMALLAHAGYETITLGEFVRFIRREKVSLPPRPLLLTFDGARLDLWTGSDEILRELDFDATLFVDEHLLGPPVAHHVRGYRPLAFAPPYGNYGQAGTNDPRIPRELLARLLDSFDVVFTQDRSGFAAPGAGKAGPVGRIEVTSDVSEEELHALLAAAPRQ